MDRERIIERERRWAVPAAVAAFAASLLFLAPIVIQQTADLYGGASAARQLQSLNDHSSIVLFASVVRALAFLALTGPLLYLFRAAQARNPRVQPRLVPFVFIGPLLFAAAGVVVAVGISRAASDFVQLTEQQPEQAKKYSKFKATVSEQAKDKTDQATAIDHVTIYSVSDSLEVKQSNGDFYAVRKFPSADEDTIVKQLDAASIDHDTQSDADAAPPDAQATDITNTSTTVQAGYGLELAARLGLIVGMVYVSLQALRAGLLTRFSGSLGIALGAAAILIPPVVFFAAILWAFFLGYLGLLFLGRLPSGRPPAWETGEPIPWQRPGEAPASGGGEAIEGDAREVDSGRSASNRSAAPRQKRKRKRRA